MADPLYHALPAPLATLFSNVDGRAKAGLPVFPGTPGTVTRRKNQHDVEFYVRRFYAPDGKQCEEYLGTGAEGARQAAEVDDRIRQVKAVLPEIRLLVREGCQVADARAFVTAAVLQRNGLFAAGATLVGSHAFGILLNELGVRAAAYVTEDVDIARRERLALGHLKGKSFIEVLRESGVDFVPVPQLDRRTPPSSFKQRDRAGFHVDLLVPSKGDQIRTVAVPKLGAHAEALPYLAYLLGQTHMATMIAREGCCPVRLPAPERFAIHKLLTSQIRVSRAAKTDKDVRQAATLIAALSDRFPGAIEAALGDLPRSARKHVAKAVPLALELLGAHPRARDELSP